MKGVPLHVAALPLNIQISPVSYIGLDDTFILLLKVQADWSRQGCCGIKFSNIDVDIDISLLIFLGLGQISMVFYIFQYLN